MKPRWDAGLPMDRWKRHVADYMVAATDLSARMSAMGFISRYPIPVDRNGELLGGAHRLACALALGLKEVPVERQDREVFAPPWGWLWFKSHGMPDEELTRLERDMEALKA